jgi:catechol 2,3-dioxygenase-like lactoylglutathione lyase family enzyme
MLHVNVNCSDFARSRAFYERLGFSVLMDIAPEGRDQVAQAVGMAQYTLQGALMRHSDGATLNLLEWQDPRDSRPPPEGLHRLGIARIALTTRNLDADVATLRAAGVEFLSKQPGAVPDALGGSSRFICFKDPDGTILELVEMGALMGGAYRASRWLPRF